MSRQRPTFGRGRVVSLIPLVAVTSSLVVLVVPSARNTIEEAVGGSGASPSAPPGLGVQAVSSSIRYASGQLLVKFREGTPQAVMDAVLAQAGATSDRAIGRVGARASSRGGTAGGGAGRAHGLARRRVRRARRSRFSTRTARGRTPRWRRGSSGPSTTALG